MGEQPSLLHTIHDHINLHATCGEGIVVHRQRATIFQRPERERNGPANRKIPGPSHTKWRKNQRRNVGIVENRSEVFGLLHGKEWHTHGPKIQTSPW